MQIKVYLANMFKRNLKHLEKFKKQIKVRPQITLQQKFANLHLTICNNILHLKTRDSCNFDSETLLYSHSYYIVLICKVYGLLFSDYKSACL